METYLQELIDKVCNRPPHLKVDRWYSDTRAGGGANIAYSFSRPIPEQVSLWFQDDIERVRLIKAQRRAERWWHKEPVQEAPSRSRFLEAKKQRFTADGQEERVTRSLNASTQMPRIQLKPKEWRMIVEDADVEDQSS